MTQDKKTKAALPPDIQNAYWFATFNALSYQIVLGSPMVLYAKYLDASATILGIVAGMMPLLVIFQIPAAKHISRVGYKRFVFAGWGTRVMFIFLIALVPLTTPFLSSPSQIGLMLFLLFCFNLSRGISSAAWLPWITALVPAQVRGHYLARDSACVNAASCATLFLSGALLGHHPKPWQFALIFGFSAVTGMASLFYLRRIPDASAPDSDSKSTQPVPWGAIASYEPFRKLLRFNMAWSLAYGGLNVFTVAWLKSAAGISEDKILYVTAVSYLGGLGGLVLFGHRLDRYGSKPILTVCLFAWILILLGWLSLASHLVPKHMGVVLVLGLAMGLGYAVYSMSNNRLAMATVPEMGRNHFFALFSVVGNLVLGVSPVLWGVLIDAWGEREFHALGFSLNRFSLFFLLVGLLYAGTLMLCSRLQEPKARNVDELLQDMLSRTPLRSWMRFWPRG